MAKVWHRAHDHLAVFICASSACLASTATAAGTYTNAGGLDFTFGMGSGHFHNMTIGLSPSHAGFSGGANFSGGGRGYSGAGSADQLARMRQGPTHPESQRNATVAMHREARPEGRFMVLARDRKIEPLPSSLHGLQIGLELTTFPVINLALALRVNPAPSNALAQLQRVQPGPTGLGRDRMPPTGSDSTRKQNKGCVTGRAKHLGGMTQNIITRNTGVIVTILVMIGGIIIAMPSFLLVGGFGVGMTAGGIRPGVTIRIIPIMTTTARSMAMTHFDPTR